MSILVDEKIVLGVGALILFLFFLSVKSLLKVRNLNTEIRNLNTEITNKDKQVLELNRHIFELNSNIDMSNAEIADKTKKIVALSRQVLSEIPSKDRLIESLSDDIDKLQDLLQFSTSVDNKEDLLDIVDILRSRRNVSQQLVLLKNRVAFLEASASNLTAIPYMAEIMADYETYGLEHLAKELDWGYAAKRMDKVKSIREIRKDAKAMVEKNKESQYQLAYLLNLFPNLEDVIETEYSQLPVIDVKELSEYDAAREYLSKEEYLALSDCERNQLALDRYMQSHSRSKWQIGRDYELYVGYKYSLKGYDVDYFGSYMGLEDLGRDVIAKKDGIVLIIQCKYWSAKKQIHENHINQLYGTMICYCLEHNMDQSSVKGILVTNITLSPMAKRMAAYLGIEYVEHFEIGEYPCIKCNIGRDEFGLPTKIYHLPFDQQYDSTKIKDPGEFYAKTVREAEDAGFRRAFRWFGSK